MIAWAHILHERKYTIELAESYTLMAPPTILFFFCCLAGGVVSAGCWWWSGWWAGFTFGRGGGA